MHGSGPWKARRAIPIAGRRLCGPLVMLAALAACDIGEAPTDPAVPGDPTATEAAGGEPDAIRSERPPDDPRAWVFEELDSPGAVLNALAVGECVLHYRRWNGKYTPVPYQLRYSGSDPDDSGFPAVLNLKRGDKLDVRASCLLPRDVEAGAEAVRGLERRIREPGFVRGPEGNLQIPTTEPARSAWAPLDSSGWATLAMRTFLATFLPSELHAQEYPPYDPPEGCLEWEWIDDASVQPWGGYWQCTGWENPDPTEPVCQDPNLEWDPATEECVCPNGGDPENDCEVAGDPPPDPDPPPGGGGPGGGAGGGGDPPPPPCQDPEQDILVQEYEGGPGLSTVTISPGCEDFTDSGGTANFD